MGVDGLRALRSVAIEEEREGRGRGAGGGVICRKDTMTRSGKVGDDNIRLDWIR